MREIENTNEIDERVLAAIRQGSQTAFAIEVMCGFEDHQIYRGLRRLKRRGLIRYNGPERRWELVPT